jgi:hypothetical protein
MKPATLIPLTAAGSSLLTALSAVTLGSRVTFLAVILVVIAGVYAAKRLGRATEEPVQPAEPVRPPLLLEAPVFINPTTGQPVRPRYTSPR